MRFIRNIPKYRLEMINLVAGAVVLTFELTASRIVAPYIGTTIYVWTSIIGIILAALAVGYALGGYIADKRHNAEDVIMMLLGASLLLIITNFVKDAVLAGIGGTGMGLQWQAFWASLVLFTLPTVVLGAISPYLVRLSLKDIAHTGRRVASISAAGTVGALLGTFLTGYVLFGFVGTRHILGFLAIVLVLTSFLLRSKALLSIRILFLAVTILCTVISPGLYISGLNADIDTRYNRVIVRDSYVDDGRPVKVLQTDKQAWQSGMYTDGDTGLALQYTRSFAAAAALRPEAERFLVIGGGAFTFPYYLAKTYPGAQVDVAELDGEFAGISQRYFGLEFPDNLHAFHADGREFLNHNRQQYDAIFVDAFSSLTPPFQLFTAETVERLRASLDPEGLAVVNVIAAATGPRADFALAAKTTYRETFRDVTFYQAIPGLPSAAVQNLTLLAGNGPLPVTLQYEPPPGSRTVPATFPRVAAGGKPGLVLTDDFAPVERLVHEW